MHFYAASSGTGWKGWMTSCRRARDATRVLATLGLSPPCPKRTSHDYAGALLPLLSPPLRPRAPSSNTPSALFSSSARVKSASSQESCTQYKQLLSR